MARIDRMGIWREDSDTRTDTELYGSLYLVCQRPNNVNDYGGNVADRAKLSNVTNAAPGSTCLYQSGEVDRLELDDWAKFGEETTETASSNASAASLNLSPLDIDRAALTKEVSFDEGEEITLEAQKSAVTSSTADEVSV